VDVPRVVRLRVNGEPVERAVRPSRTLLEMLRYDLDLVGTKQGCDKGDCGACTVLVDGKAVLSCLTLAAARDGKEVSTVESLPVVPKLDPLLDAFDRLGAGQCGFCTPGMLASARALLAEHPEPSREQIRVAISGNLCRCTGYGPIVEAVHLASRIARGDDPGGFVRQGEEAPGRPLPPNERKA
jgi:carbon-monoxide dehydrogenase small subunit